MKRKTSKRLEACILAMMLLVGLTACQSKRSSNEGEEVVEAQSQYDYNKERSTTEFKSAENQDDTLPKGINQFTFSMAAKLNADENYFFSPYSICSALTLLDNAAGGDAKKELEELMGITDLDHWNQQLSYFMKRENSEETRLLSANALWINKGYELSDEAYKQYFPLLNYYYTPDVYNADYSGDPESVRTAINAWISEKTEGKITDFKKNVSRDTMIDIVNAVYFYGEWMYTFSEDSTRKSIFYGANGAEQTVERMNQQNTEYKYYVDHGIRSISVPYKGNTYAMNILIPEDDTQNIQNLFAQLTDEEKQEYLNSLMEAERVEITEYALPKFDMKCNTDIKEVFLAMGKEGIFGEGQYATGLSTVN